MDTSRLRDCLYRRQKLLRGQAIFLTVIGSLRIAQIEGCGVHFAVTVIGTVIGTAVAERAAGLLAVGVRAANGKHIVEPRCEDWVCRAC